MASVEQKTLFPYIQELTKLLDTYHIAYRFVGGVSFGGLLNEETTWEIDIKNRTIILTSANTLPISRSDGTMKDIDIITLSQEKLPKEITDYINNPTHPPTIIEQAIFAPQKINSVAQMVTDMYVDQNHQLYLVFEPIKQPISWKSLEPWKVTVEKQSYTVRNPIADYFAYHFRSPSGVKPKDEKKVYLIKKLMDDVIKEGKKYQINYLSEEYFGTWEQYVTRLQSSSESLIKGKQLVMSLYWSTIGEYLAHGKGIGKFFMKLQNKFTGSF